MDLTLDSWELVAYEVARAAVRMLVQIPEQHWYPFLEIWELSSGELADSTGAYRVTFKARLASGGFRSNQGDSTNTDLIRIVDFNIQVEWDELVADWQCKEGLMSYTFNKSYEGGPVEISQREVFPFTAELVQGQLLITKITPPTQLD